MAVCAGRSSVPLKLPPLNLVTGTVTFLGSACWRVIWLLSAVLIYATQQQADRSILCAFHPTSSNCVKLPALGGSYARISVLMLASLWQRGDAPRACIDFSNLRAAYSWYHKQSNNETNVGDSDNNIKRGVGLASGGKNKHIFCAQAPQHCCRAAEPRRAGRALITPANIIRLKA